jgi:putative ABC transport system permease protein
MLIIVMTGVLGLVSLNVSKRNKEIGIRKVLGATVPGILIMLSKEYVRLMIVSFVLAIPLAYYFASTWLQNFVYHINLSWWMFALPGFLLIVITIVIVSIQSYQTASADPVKSLKYE